MHYENALATDKRPPAWSRRNKVAAALDLFCDDEPARPSATASLYQKRAVSLQQVIDRIETGDPETVSNVILSVSPCRSGTTVLLRTFGAVGIEAHFQPLKNVLRWQLQGRDSKWQAPQRPYHTVYLKETLGPYTEAEARFNPLDVLLKAGYPPAKLHVLIVGRAPLSTWASWYQWWGKTTTADKLILAYQTTERVKQQAQRYEIPTTALVYEAFRDNRVENVIRSLFSNLNVPFSPIATKGWRKLPAFGTPGSGIILPQEPPVFVMPRIHEPAKKSDGLEFFSRAASILGLRKDDVTRIAEACLSDIYEGWRTVCEQSLHVTVEQDHEWDLYRTPAPAIPLPS